MITKKILTLSWFEADMHAGMNSMLKIISNLKWLMIMLKGILSQRNPTSSWDYRSGNKSIATS